MTYCSRLNHTASLPEPPTGHKPLNFKLHLYPEIDYAQLIKTYASSQEETRYSPAICTSCESKRVMGQPDPKHISTSYVERQNLNMRMGMRRFTRLTNAFSKIVENHACILALYYMFYNFCRIHKTLRVTPAMEAGVSAHVWTVEEIAALLPEPTFGPRGPYKKRANKAL